MRVENVGINQTVDAQRRGGAELGKDEFMTILVTQLQHQDPLRPMDDREFIAQMAQFTALEQMQNLNNELARVKAVGLIGKFVLAEIQADGHDTKALYGMVEGIGFRGGAIDVLVNGQQIAMEDIVSVHSAPQTSGPVL